MSAQLPIVCSLTATELPVRLAEIADLGRTALLSGRRSATIAGSPAIGLADVAPAASDVAQRLQPQYRDYPEDDAADDPEDGTDDGDGLDAHGASCRG